MISRQEYVFICKHPSRESFKPVAPGCADYTFTEFKEICDYRIAELQKFSKFLDWESHYNIAELQKFSKSLEIFGAMFGNLITVSQYYKKF